MITFPDRGVCFMASSILKMKSLLVLSWRGSTTDSYPASYNPADSHDGRADLVSRAITRWQRHKRLNICGFPIWLKMRRPFQSQTGLSLKPSSSLGDEKWTMWMSDNLYRDKCESTLLLTCLFLRDINSWERRDLLFLCWRRACVFQLTE